MEMPPPGWYEDPVDAADLLRWWDGTQWTEHNAPAGNIPQAAIERAPVTDRGHRAIERAPDDLFRAPEDLPGASASPMLSAPVDRYVAAASPAPPLGPRRPAAPPAVQRDDPSLTDWFQSIPYPVAGMNNPALANSTGTVLERGGPGTLAEFGWPNGTPVTEDDTPLLERNDKTGPLLHNRTRLMWGWPSAPRWPCSSPASWSRCSDRAPRPSSRPRRHTPRPSGRWRRRPRPHRRPPRPPPVLGGDHRHSGDRRDVRPDLRVARRPLAGRLPELDERRRVLLERRGGRAGGHGRLGGRHPLVRHRLLRLLSQQVPYTGVADLPQTATTLAGTFDSGYDNSLPHDSVTQQNNPLQVSGHPAWIVEFQQTFQNAAAEGLAWQTALNAVVVVDRGTGQMPAMLYVSVPDNLGTANVGAILASLQLNAPAAAASPGASAAASPGATPPVPAANGASPGAGNP
jgi:hypothetical protein